MTIAEAIRKLHNLNTLFCNLLIYLLVPNKSTYDESLVTSLKLSLIIIQVIARATSNNRKTFFHREILFWIRAHTHCEVFLDRGELIFARSMGCCGCLVVRPLGEALSFPSWQRIKQIKQQNKTRNLWIYAVAKPQLLLMVWSARWKKFPSKISFFLRKNNLNF